MINREALVSKLRSLGKGDTAFQAATYPGVYPSDQSIHDAVKAGEPPTLAPEFSALIHELAGKGVSVERLRIMPDVGQFACDHADIAAMNTINRASADLPMSVRTAGFDRARRVFMKLGRSRHGVEYLRGIRERQPQQCFWATYGAVGRVATMVCLINYIRQTDGLLVPKMEIHTPPYERELWAWYKEWRLLYDDAEPVEPLSLSQ